MTKFDQTTFAEGLEVRKEVLGESYVRESLESADEFTSIMQEFVTTFCWGAVWGREGLPKKTRSLINLGMISALNRPHEFKVHVRGALNNGVSSDEIQEVLLQVAVYCGAPAALESFRLAKEVLDQQEACENE